MKKFERSDGMTFYVNDGTQPQNPSFEEAGISAMFFDTIARFAIAKLFAIGLVRDVRLMPITVQPLECGGTGSIFTGIGVHFTRGYSPIDGTDHSQPKAFFTIVADFAPPTMEGIADVANFEARTGAYATIVGWHLSLVVSKSPEFKKPEENKLCVNFHDDMVDAVKTSAPMFETATGSTPICVTGKIAEDEVAYSMADVVCQYIYENAKQLFNWSDDDEIED